jgi:RimJ/RimL family protein N-acetyltransferase
MKQAKPLSELLWGHAEAVANWVWQRCDKIHRQLPENTYQAVGVVDGNGVQAGFIFHDWLPEFGTIDMTLAAETPRWASRRIIRQILSYPFVTLDCQRITVVTSEQNKLALRLAEGVGFKREATIERAYGPNENAVLLRLFKEDWLSGKYGVTENG